MGFEITDIGVFRSGSFWKILPLYRRSRCTENIAESLAESLKNLTDLLENWKVGEASAHGEAIPVRAAIRRKSVSSAKCLGRWA